MGAVLPRRHLSHGLERAAAGAAGSTDIVASRASLDAWTSSSAEMTRAPTFPRSASACRDIDRFIDSGNVHLHPFDLDTPRLPDGASMISVSSAPSFSRFDSRSSSALPITDRNDV